MTDASSSAATALIDALQPERLWTGAEVLVRPSPIPPVPEVYGWHFTEAPAPSLDAGRLLYVGIAPRHMANRASGQHMANRASGQHLRKRIRYHYRGNAYGSALRLTLGCLLGLSCGGWAAGRA